MSACVKEVGESDAEKEIPSDKNGLHPVVHKYPTILPKKGFYMECPVMYISRSTHPFEKYYESTEKNSPIGIGASNDVATSLQGSKVALITDHASVRSPTVSPLPRRFGGGIGKSPGTVQHSTMSQTMPYQSASGYCIPTVSASNVPSSSPVTSNFIPLAEQQSASGSLRQG